MTEGVTEQRLASTAARSPCAAAMCSSCNRAKTATARLKETGSAPSRTRKPTTPTAEPRLRFGVFFPYATAGSTCQSDERAHQMSENSAAKSACGHAVGRNSSATSMYRSAGTGTYVRHAKVRQSVFWYLFWDFGYRYEHSKDVFQGTSILG